jgi:hypothetical protein
MDPKNHINLNSVKDLMELISDISGNRLLEPIKSELARIRPGVVVNRVRDSRDLATTSILQHVARRYLLMKVEDLGGVLYDPQIERMVSEMMPLTDYREGGAFESVYGIALALTSKSRPRLDSAEVPSLRSAGKRLAEGPRSDLTLA